MHLYLYPHPDTIDASTIDSWIALFPPDQQSYIGKIKSPLGRAQATIANMLLLVALDGDTTTQSNKVTIHWVSKNDLEQSALHLQATPTLFPPFDIAERGKPYLRNTPHLFFNLSHCRNIVACILHHSEVGVDVECRRTFKESFLQRVFSYEEQQQVHHSSDPEMTFVQLWTRKEAYVKYTGTGILGLDFLQGIPPAIEPLQIITLPLTELEGYVSIITQAPTLPIEG